MTAVRPSRTLTLKPCTVSELMTENPLSIPATATATEAVQMLTEHRFSAAPVIDEAGHPIGVISRTDLVKRLLAPPRDGQFLEDEWLQSDNRQVDIPLDNESIPTLRLEGVTVNEIMTPTVVGLSPDASLEYAVELMLKEEVHRLFVLDADGVLVGVISTFDILRHLCYVV